MADSVAREFFYLKDRRKQDAALHEPILAEGDTATAFEISRKVAKRLGLTDAENDALMRPLLERAAKQAKDWDEGRHPRVPAGGHGGGQFAPGTGGAGGDAQASPDKPLLIGTGTSRERIEGWKQQLEQRQEELDKQGGLGSKEDIETQRMLGSLEAYLRAPEADIRSGQKALREVHDLDGNLQAAVFSQFDPKRRVATMEFVGGLDQAAKVKALQHTVLFHQETNRAERIEANEFADDETGNLAAYEQAGFQKIGGTSGGIQRFIIGAEKTDAEKDIEARSTAEHAQRVLKLSRDVAKELGFDPDKITISTNAETSTDFTLNGREMKAAGLAYTHGPENGIIKIFPEQLIAGTGSFSEGFSEQQIKGVAAHEVEHIKYQTALDKFAEESKLVMAEPPPPPDPNAEHYAGRIGGPSAIMKPDGTLYPPYDKKFPNYQAMQKAFFLPGWDKFRDSDGVSSYSADYWKELHATNNANLYNKAIHETLAEMGRIKYTHGKFPEHKGSADPSNPKPTKAQMAGYAKIWRDLYRTVEKVYKGKA